MRRQLKRIQRLGLMNRILAGSSGRQAPAMRVGFLLILVMLVIAMASLAMLNFSRSMLISNEVSHISSGRLQARMCAESGAQAIRLFLSNSHEQRLAQGGTLSNAVFQARNVMPHVWPQKRGNYTIIAPALDEAGNYHSIRYGLQNESAKLNLNALLQIDQLARTGALAPAESDSTGDGSNLDPLAGADGTTAARNILLALPGMTADVADAILDWLDSDDTPREYGAESEYYTMLQPPYKPANRSIESVEQLLLVRGVTPQLLYGYDENHNGMLDPGETERLSLGIAPGSMPGQINVASLDPNYVPPPPLGLAQYLTLHSREKNVTFQGNPRININGSDLQTLYSDLQAALGNEDWASFIVAYRMGGRTSNPAANPLNMFSNLTSGVEKLGVSSSNSNNASSSNSGGSSSSGTQPTGTQSNPNGQGGSGQGNPSDGSGNPQANGDPQTNRTPVGPWSSNLLSEFDLTEQPLIQFQQILDLFDATVTIGQGAQARTYTSPFTSSQAEFSETSQIVMDLLTTVSAAAIPGRINIMECPREVLMCIPGMTAELVESILVARSAAYSPEKRYETWLVIDGLVPLDQLRGVTPMITCGGDVYKAQVIGYLEGEAAFSRIETMIDAAGTLPEIKFYRRLDHLGRGFSIPTLGQRPDAAFVQ